MFDARWRLPTGLAVALATQGCADLVGAGFDGLELVADAGADATTAQPSAVPGTLGGGGIDAVTDLCFDTEGNAYLAGYFSETVDFGDGDTRTSPDMDAFVASYSAAGEKRWVHTFGGLGRVSFVGDLANAVTCDRDGNVYVTGGFSSPTIDLGGGPLQKVGGPFDAFVGSYTAQGTFRWSNAVQSARWDVGRAIDVQGNSVVIAGERDLTTTLDAGRFTARWSLDLGTPPGEELLVDSGSGLSLGTATNDDRYCVAGCYDDPTTFGDVELDSEDHDPYVVCRSPDSTVESVWSFREQGYDCASDIAFGPGGDGDSNVAYVVGLTQRGDNQDWFLIGGLEVGPTAAATHNVRFSELTTTDALRDGFVQRVRTGIPRFDYIFPRVAVDESGNVFVAAVFVGQIEIGGEVLRSAGGQDIVLTSWEPSGHLRWARRLGGAFRDGVPSLTIFQRTLYVVGAFSGDLEIDGTMRSSRGSDDGFVLALDPATGRTKI